MDIRSIGRNHKGEGSNNNSLMYGNKENIQRSKIT